MSTQLNDLTHRLALLASVSGCTVSVRLLGGEHGNVIELKATQSSDAEAREYRRQLSLRALGCLDPRQLATDFICEARLAFATGQRLLRRSAPRSRAPLAFVN